MLLVVGAVLCRHWLERSMALHMLLQLPLLLIAGILMAFGLPDAEGNQASRIGRVIRRLRAFDEHGLTGLFALLFITAYWMIPKALEHVLDSPMTELFKFVSVWCAGVMLPGALSRSNRIIQLFFLGNFASMTAIVGMLYQDAPQRLCNAYLLDDQVATGTGLVILAIGIPLLWCAQQCAVNAGDGA